MDYKRRCDEDFAKNMENMEKINSLVNYFINLMYNCLKIINLYERV